MADNNNNTLFIIGLVLFLLWAGTNQGTTPDPSTQPPSPDVSDSVDFPDCSIEDISFVPKMSRLGKTGTSLSTSSYNYYILSGGLGSVNADTATNFAPNAEIQVMFAESATDYYTVVNDINVDCVDPFFHTVELPFVEKKFQSFYIRNSDGSVNSVTNAEAMGASSSFEATIIIKASVDEYFGNPASNCENIGVVEYNRDLISLVEGSNFKSVPGSFTFNSTNYDGANAFVIPKVGNNEEKSFNIRIDSNADPDGTNQPFLHLFDCDFDKNEETLELIEGIQDEDVNGLSLAHQNATIYLS